MSDKSFELSRRKALGAIASVGVGAAVTGAGTFAAFSDSATDDSSDNSLSSGTLDLQFGGGTESEATGLTLSASNMAPGDTGTQLVQLENKGTLPGNLSVTLDAITNGDGDAEAGQSADDETAGRLTDALQVQFWMEPVRGSNDTQGALNGNSGVEAVLTPSSGAAKAGTSSATDLVTADNYFDDTTDTSPGPSYGPVVELVPEADEDTANDVYSGYSLGLNWSLPTNADNLNDIDDINAVMGDTATFELSFTMNGSTNTDVTTTL
jgi:predicted ribosomally synthesized peptide with SipW-like signal peptide